jgi:hypothetical protein
VTALRKLVLVQMRLEAELARLVDSIEDVSTIASPHTARASSGGVISPDALALAHAAFERARLRALPFLSQTSSARVLDIAGLAEALNSTESRGWSVARPLANPLYSLLESLR